LRLTRREFCQSTAFAALATALGLSALPALTEPALAQASVPEAELMAANTLPDMVLGDPKAPVTVIEYASMTCSHCANFAEKTFPAIKSKYIDTGKVRFIFREFPLDRLAAAVFMLARCSADNNPDKYFAFVDIMFHQQRTWAVEKPLEPLLTISKQAGFTQETFNACLSNQKVLDGIEAMRQRGAEKFKVQSTPSFFINGKLYTGALSTDEMSKIIDPLIKS
jgi:protein-disulfide isomerase